MPVESIEFADTATKRLCTSNERLAGEAEFKRFEASFPALSLLDWDKPSEVMEQMFFIRQIVSASRPIP